MSDPALREVGVAEAVALARDGYRLIDVREPVEWDEGHVADATLVPLADLPTRIAEEVPDRATPLLLYCRSGARSARAAGWLAQMGYTDVVNLKGYIADWEAAGGAWAAPALALTPDQARRYTRQMALPEVGPEGQLRLLDSRVLIVGAGGLGSPVALYLAAAGIGTLGIVDDDNVEETNLHRQVIHGTDRIGSAKVASAEAAVHRLNPEVVVVGHAERLSSESAERIVGGYDVVVDATDSLETRYVLNDAAVRLRRPMVHGSVHRWEGEVTSVVPYEGPCYRCIHPRQPPADLVADCDVAGVIGAVPGLVGILQATEVLKLVLGVGQPLVGRLLLVDALSGSFEEIRVERDPDCPACGASAVEASARSAVATG